MGKEGTGAILCEEDVEPGFLRISSGFFVLPSHESHRPWDKIEVWLYYNILDPAR